MLTHGARMTRDKHEKPRQSARATRLERANELARLAERSNNPAARAAYLQLAAAFRHLADRPGAAKRPDGEL